MIAFNKTALQNTFLVDEALSLKNSGFITNDELVLVKNQNNPLKSNKNVLLRFGFFLLGSFLFGSIMSLLAWFTIGINSNSNTSIVVLFALYSIVGIIICEFLTQEHYRYGIDDAFIVGTIASVCIFVFTLINYIVRSDENDYLNFKIYIFISMTITGLLACLRYCHWFSATICLIGTTGTFYYLISPYTIGIKLMPFLMMLLAALFYFIHYRLSKTNKTYYYLNSLIVLKVFSLVLFYLSGNYLVVRTLSENLMGNYLKEGQDIPFAIFFWIFTFVVPAFYLYFSITNKDKVFLNIGFISFCFSIFTFRMFHSVLPAEIALTLAGILIFTVTYFIIKKLKNNESGVTFKPDRNTNSNNLINLEAAIINSQVTMSQQIDNSPMEFKGGDFSGGGAGDTF